MSVEDRLLNQGELCLVIGASGYIGSYIVKTLVERGYKVRAAVRNISDESKFIHLKNLFPKVELIQADLLDEASLNKAVVDVKVIFSCTAPAVSTSNPTPQDQIDAAVNGTLNILKAASNEPSVKRIILTSTLGTVISNKSDDYVFTENDWCESSISTPALHARRLAEEKAIEYTKNQNQFDIIITNPGGILGPPLGKRIESSVKLFKSIVDGSSLQDGVIPFAVPLLDVRDAGLAHVLAAEKKSANGRYMLCSKDTYSFLEMVGLMKASGKYTNIELPSKERGPSPKKKYFDNSKLTQLLGLGLSSPQEAIFDTVDFLLAVPK